DRAAVLEGVPLEAEPRRDVGAVQQRSAPDTAANRLGGADDVVAREGFGAHAPILDTASAAECARGRSHATPDRDPPRRRPRPAAADRLLPAAARGPAPLLARAVDGPCRGGGRRRLGGGARGRQGAQGAAQPSCAACAPDRTTLGA